MIRNLCHKGFWRYKKEHFQKAKVEQTQHKETLVSLFCKEMDGVLEDAKGVSDLEAKIKEAKEKEEIKR